MSTKTEPVGGEELFGKAKLPKPVGGVDEPSGWVVVE